MSNTIGFCGRLGRDAELKEVGETTVLNFTVANNTGFGDRQATTWFNCQLWGKQGERLEQYLTKGKQVFVTGEFTARKYTSKDGAEKISLDVRVSNIDFVGSKGDSAGEDDDSGTRHTERTPRASPSETKSSGNKEDDEDLPF